MYQLTLVNAALIVMILGFALLMYRFNRQNPRYNIVDMLIGGDGRASVSNHIQLALASLSVWVVVDRELDGKDVETILLGVLGVFVVKQGAVQITDILNKPTAPGATVETVETKVEKKTVNPIKKVRR